MERKTSKLLELLKNEFISYLYPSLCDAIHMLYYEIDVDEFLRLHKVIVKHKPFKVKLKQLDFKPPKNTGGFYWKKYKLKPRIKFLDKLIKYYKSLND